MPALAFISLFKLAVQNVRRDARVLWAHRLRNHTIVCGLGDTGRQVVESFRDAGKSVVAIALDAGTPHAAACERRRVAVLQGDAAQPNMLKVAGLKHAQSLIIACGSDGADLEIAMRARDMLKGERNHSVKILPELRSEWLYDLVKTQGASALGSPEADFQLFNLNINAARALLRSEIFMRAIPDAAPQPHLLFAGFGRMGSELLVRAARSNFAVPGQRLSATILDERGPASIMSAEIRCSSIREIADLEFTHCEFTSDDPSWHAIAEATLKERPPMAVIVAVGLDEVALNTAMRFRKILDELGRFATPVFVRIRQQHRLGEFLSQLESQSPFGDRVKPFGGLSFLTSPEVLLDQALDVLARAAHEVWLKSSGNSGSPAAVPWERLTEFHKQSNRALADYVAIRLRCCGFRLTTGRGSVIAFDDATVEKLAALEHWRWYVELRSMGWQFAEDRDDFLKQHNRLVEWSALPEQTKQYNREMARRIPEIADAAGMSVKRDRFGFADLDRSLQDVLENPEPGTQGVIVVDPGDANAWRRAQAAAQKSGAKIWALLREGTSPQLFKRLQTEASDAAAVEMWLSESEFMRLQRERNSS
jgi:hypothetical protein